MPACLFIEWFQKFERSHSILLSQNSVLRIQNSDVSCALKKEKLNKA